MKSLAAVTRDAASLPRADRIKLARIMLDLTEDAPDPTAEVDAEWEAEIQRRIADVSSGNVPGIPLDVTKARIEKRLGL